MGGLIKYCPYFFLTYCIFLSTGSYGQSLNSDSLLERSRKIEHLILTDIDKAYELGIDTYQFINQNKVKKKARASVLVSMSRVYNALADYPLAVKLGLEAAALYKEISDHNNLIRSYAMLGGIYYDINEFDRTILFTRKALALAKKHKIESQLAILHNNLSGVYLKTDSLQEAYNQIQLALTHLTLVSPRIQAHIYITLSEIETDLGRNFQASEAIEEAKKIYQKNEIEDKKLQCSILIQESNLQLKQGQVKEALITAQRCYQLAKEAGFLIMMMESAEILSQCYNELGELDSANHYQMKFKQLKENIWNENNSKNADKELILAREEELAKNAIKAQNQQSVIITIIIFSLALTILLILLFILNKRQRSLLRTIKKQKEEIELKNEELKSFHEVKDKIYSTVVHDFKTPLNSLENILHLLEDQKLNSDHLSQLSGKLKLTISSSKESINNLIVWAKNQMEGIEPQYRELSLANFLQRLKSYHQLNLDAKNISLELTEILPKSINTDPDILFIVCNNILSNAIKFSPINKTIFIHISEEGDSMIFKIKDEGEGIAHDILEEIFSTNKVSSHGTGLGLNITKELLEKIEGKIHIDSQPEKGTTVSISIPHQQL